MKKIFLNIFNIFNMCKNRPSKVCPEKDKRNFVLKLIDDDNNFSTANFFLVAMTFVGIIMLLVPVAGMIVDMFYNHTITINLSDMGSYILAVSGIFGVAGLSNAWVEYSWNKYGQNIFNQKKEEDDDTPVYDTGESGECEC